MPRTSNDIAYDFEFSPQPCQCSSLFSSRSSPRSRWVPWSIPTSTASLKADTLEKLMSRTLPSASRKFPRLRPTPLASSLAFSLAASECQFCWTMQTGRLSCAYCGTLSFSSGYRDPNAGYWETNADQRCNRQNDSHLPHSRSVQQSACQRGHTRFSRRNMNSN